MNLSVQASVKASLRTAAGALARAAWLLVLFGPVQAQEATSGCGALGKPFGDYLVDKDKVAMSESNHFTPEVESLIRGKTSVKPGSDIDFILIAIPNHHRALVAMMRLGEKTRSPQPEGAKYPVGCYFERAVRFRPHDIVSRMLYATYLSKNARTAEANAQLEVAKRAAEDDPFSHYNIGLIYLEMKNFDQALLQAHKADELGFNRTDLRDRLKSAGRWKDPQPTAAASNTAPATAPTPTPASASSPDASAPEAPSQPASAAN